MLGKNLINTTTTETITCPRCGQLVWVTREPGRPANIQPHCVTSKKAVEIISKGKAGKKDFACRD